jgi:hypothetical protein
MATSFARTWHRPSASSMALELSRPVTEGCNFHIMGSLFNTLAILISSNCSPMEKMSFCFSQRLSEPAAQHQKVVAVVGAAHVPGICARFPDVTLWQTSPEGNEWKATYEEQASQRKVHRYQASRLTRVMRLSLGISESDALVYMGSS